MPNKLQWGKRWDSSISHSLGWDCPTCGFVPKGVSNVIGFDEVEGNKIVQIMECLKDFTKFWFHQQKYICEIFFKTYPEKFRDVNTKSENQEGRKMR